MRTAAPTPTPTPAPPWGSSRLPRTLSSDDPRHTLFRELLRHAEGVPVAFPDATTGRVGDVVFPMLDFDFWPDALIVETPAGKRRVPISAVAQLDVRPACIEVGDADVVSEAVLAAEQLRGVPFS
jgi:hypothetical protein